MVGISVTISWKVPGLCFAKYRYDRCHISKHASTALSPSTDMVMHILSRESVLQVSKKLSVLCGQGTQMSW